MGPPFSDVDPRCGNFIWVEEASDRSNSMQSSCLLLHSTPQLPGYQVPTIRRHSPRIQWLQILEQNQCFYLNSAIPQDSKRKRTCIKPSIPEYLPRKEKRITTVTNLTPFPVPQPTNASSHQPPPWFNPLSSESVRGLSVRLCIGNMKHGWGWSSRGDTLGKL